MTRIARIRRGDGDARVTYFVYLIRTLPLAVEVLHSTRWLKVRFEHCLFRILPLTCLPIRAIRVIRG
jgi:hypothetical protein